MSARRARFEAILPPTAMETELKLKKRRAYVTAKRLAEIDQGLSDRDRRILEFVAESYYVTTNQIERACLVEGTPLARARMARRLLWSLVGKQLLFRLERSIGGIGGGSGSGVFTLDRAGVWILARQRGEPERRFRPPEERGLSFLLHTLSVTEHLVTLIEHVRSLTDTELLRWLGEPGCHRSFRFRGKEAWLRPDALVEVRTGAEIVTSLLEVDRSTQSLPTLARKLRGYLRYARIAPLETPKVIVSIESPRRMGALDELLPLLARQEGVATAATRRLIQLGGRGEAVMALAGEEVRP